MEQLSVSARGNIMKPIPHTTRRGFLQKALAGSAVATAGASRIFRAPAQTAHSVLPGPSRATLMTGADHADLIFRSLKPFQKEIAEAIGRKRVLIKPNNVMMDRLLTSTPPECLEGILEFLHSIRKKDIVIAESAANGPTMEGFSNYGYDKLAARYQARLIDLDRQDFTLLYLVDQKDFQPHPLRIARPMLDPDTFLISATRFKTHDRVVHGKFVLTLSGASACVFRDS